MTTARCVLDARAWLGEGPLWDVREQALYWVDIKRREVHRFNPADGSDQSWAVDKDVGSLAVRERGGLVLALSDGFYTLDLSSGATEVLARPEPECGDNRFNDGKPDRQGRFWASSMHDPETDPTGALYCLYPDAGWRRMVEHIAVGNALCWSPDGRVMYYGDSLAQTVWAWDFEPASGEIANRRVFITLSDGFPDGATVDADAHLWLAVWNGWRLERYRPDGTLERRVPLPVQCPTCPAFGGPDLATLYVTSASNVIDEPQRQPQAGGIFALDVGVCGLEERRFQG